MGSYYDIAGPIAKKPILSAGLNDCLLCIVGPKLEPVVPRIQQHPRATPTDVGEGGGQYPLPASLYLFPPKLSVPLVPAKKYTQ